MELEKLETPDDVAKHNIKICDKFKKADYLELSCLSWLKNDSKRNYQDLEKLFRDMDLDSYIIAQTISNIPIGLEIGKPNKLENVPNKLENVKDIDQVDQIDQIDQIDQVELEYVANITCTNKENSIKELLKHHTSYEENFECLKKTGCLMSIKNNKPKEDDVNEKEMIQKTQNIDEIKKLLECKLKLDLELYDPMESINYIIKDLFNKYGREPEKIVCGEIGCNKVWALMLDGQIISPIGWMEKEKTIHEQFEHDESSNNYINYELIDFRKIKIERQ